MKLSKENIFKQVYILKSEAHTWSEKGVWRSRYLTLKCISFIFIYFVSMSVEARGSHWVPFFFLILTLQFEAESLTEPGVHICDSSLTNEFSDPPVSTSLLLLCRCMSLCMAFWCGHWGSALWSSCFVASALSAEPPECILFGNDF